MSIKRSPALCEPIDHVIASDVSGEEGSKIEADGERARLDKNALDLVKNSRERVRRG
jgi:hypothetical protein